MPNGSANVAIGLVFFASLTDPSAFRSTNPSVVTLACRVSCVTRLRSTDAATNRRPVISFCSTLIQPVGQIVS